MKITAQYRQSLADIALQACGSLEAIFALAERNGMSITDEPKVGQTLVYELSDVVSKRDVRAYSEDGVTPAGAVDDALLQSLVDIVEEDHFGDIDDSSDAVEPAVLTTIFTKEFDIQFA